MSARIQIPLRVDQAMLDRIEDARGLVSREAWIRNAISFMLDGDGPREDVPPDGGSEAYRSPRVVRSEDVRRRPLPKGGR